MIEAHSFGNTAAMPSYQVPSFVSFIVKRGLLTVSLEMVEAAFKQGKLSSTGKWAADGGIGFAGRDRSVTTTVKALFK